MIDSALPTVYGFLLVLFRCAALCMVAPILGSKPVSTPIRLSMACVGAFAAFLGAGAPQVDVPSSPLPLAWAALAETAIGLCAGFAAKAVLDAAQAAGQTAGLAMGLGFGALVDPASGAENAAVGELFATIGLGLAVAFGLHREAFAWLSRSVHELPPGASVNLAAITSHAIAQTLMAISLAVRIAFPLVGAALFGHATLAAMGRAAPQLNLSSVGFSVSILAGGLAIYLFAPAGAELAAQAAMNAFR